jgi:hypothetical protein
VTGFLAHITTELASRTGRSRRDAFLEKEEFFMVVPARA